MKACFLFFFTMWSSAVVSSTLTLDDGLELMAFNGQKYKGDTQTVTLNEGQNQIVIRVYDNFRKGSNEELFTSTPYVLSFDAESSDVELMLSPKLNDFRKVDKAFRKGAPIWLLKRDGKLVEFSSEPLPGNGGFIPYADIEGLIVAFNQENGISINNEAVVNLQEAAVVVQDNGDIEITGDPITQLKLWYTKATKEERKTFRKWMIDQE